MTMTQLGVVNNQAKESVCQRHGQFVKPLNDLFEGLGLKEPITLAQIEGLSPADKGKLGKSLAVALAEMFAKTESREIEGNLVDAGYASINDAIAGIPDQMGGSNIDRATITLTAVRDLLTVIDGLTADSAFIVTLAGIVMEAKAALDAAHKRVIDVTEV